MVDFMAIKEVPWKNMGKPYTNLETVPNTSKGLIQVADLDWHVDSAVMFTELHNSVMNYHAIYQVEDNTVIGAVNKFPSLVQNERMFNMVEDLIRSRISPETAGAFEKHRMVFGCFKVQDKYEILGDNIDQYFIIVNDHLKCDGKVQVVFAPVRIVCQNTLTAALGMNTLKFRVNVSDDAYINREIGRSIFDHLEVANHRLEVRMEKFARSKISEDDINKIFDKFYPFETDSTGDLLLNRHNENVQTYRDTIRDCMEADDLSDYRGTVFQLFNGMADFVQHYYAKLDNSYDINYRMKLIPSLGTGTEADKLIKLNSMVSEFLAA